MSRFSVLKKLQNIFVLNFSDLIKTNPNLASRLISLHNKEEFYVTNLKLNSFASANRAPEEKPQSFDLQKLLEEENKLPTLSIELRSDTFNAIRLNIGNNPPEIFIFPQSNDSLKELYEKKIFNLQETVEARFQRLSESSLNSQFLRRIIFYFAEISPQEMEKKSLQQEYVTHETSKQHRNAKGVDLTFANIITTKGVDLTFANIATIGSNNFFTSTSNCESLGSIAHLGSVANTLFGTSILITGSHNKTAESAIEGIRSQLNGRNEESNLLMGKIFNQELTQATRAIEHEHRIEIEECEFTSATAYEKMVEEENETQKNETQENETMSSILTPEQLRALEINMMKEFNRQFNKKTISSSIKPTGSSPLAESDKDKTSTK